MNILISGIPGGGKTHLGNLLAKDHGFRHVDMEADEFADARACMRSPEAFVAELGVQPDRNVLTWGFDPFRAEPAVKHIVSAGFVPVWVDGNRAFFFSTFLRRERRNEGMELAFYQQMTTIVMTRIGERLDWFRFDPFDSWGDFIPAPAVRLLDGLAQRSQP